MFNNPQATQVQINPQYNYDDQDVKKILESRIASHKNPNSPKRNIIVHVCENLAENASSPSSLVNILKNELNNNTPRIVLIPCNYNNSHIEDASQWVGIFLRFEPGGKINAIYFDPLNEEPVVPSEILAYFESVLNRIEWYQTPQMQDQSQDQINSGPLVVESLFLASFNMKLPLNQDIVQIRLKHLSSLFANDKAYVQTFYPKQLAGGAAKAEVDAEIDDLYRTVISLERNTKELFSEQSPQTDPMTAAQLEKKFKTVCDANGQLKLQLRQIVNDKQITRFLYRPSFSEHKIAFMRDYSYSLMGGTLGLAASVGRGVGMNAAMLAAKEGAQLGLKQALLGTATLFDPLALGGAAVWVAGSAVATRQSRTFAGNIQKAYELYEESTANKEDEKLERADKILRAEFSSSGVTQKLYKPTRWLATPYVQYDFAHLLWAQIRARQGDAEALVKYKYVYDNTREPTIKAMSLIGQIAFLADEDNFKNEQNALDVEARKKAIDCLVVELKRKHGDIVKQYFKVVLQSYESILEMARHQVYLKSDEEFAAAALLMDRIINYKDLHCMRYLLLDGKSEPIGKIAEVAFTFAQALCHVILEKRFPEKLNNVAEENKLKHEIDNALAKMQRCEELMILFALDAESKNSPLLKNILADVTSYIKTYREKNRLASEAQQPRVSKDNVISPGLMSWMSETAARAGTTFTFTAAEANVSSWNPLQLFSNVIQYCRGSNHSQPTQDAKSSASSANCVAEQKMKAQ